MLGAATVAVPAFQPIMVNTCSQTSLLSPSIGKGQHAFKRGLSVLSCVCPTYKPEQKLDWWVQLMHEACSAEAHLNGGCALG